MRAQKMVLYNIEWQQLRIGLAFTNEDTVKTSLETIGSYLDSPLKGYDTEENKLWRVLNLLNATRMGMAGQLKRFGTDSPHHAKFEAVSEAVRVYRDTVSKQYKEIKPKQFIWEEPIEVQSLQDTEIAALKAVYKSLTARRKFAAEVKKAKTEVTRPELLYYIDMLEKELTTREESM